ncbi:MAG: helix-turn-helix domain-containing protein [Oligoflexia bacterium]|nr:helix-turn-helix domain-containing protein [Oligoflexia bacterium]
MVASRNPNHDSKYDLDALLTEQQAAAFIGFTPRALQSWRCRGGGPVFVRVSARAIRYRLRDLMSWVEERLRSSTSDKGGAV